MWTKPEYSFPDADEDVLVRSIAEVRQFIRDVFHDLMALEDCGAQLEDHEDRISVLEDRWSVFDVWVDVQGLATKCYLTDDDWRGRDFLINSDAVIGSPDVANGEIWTSYNFNRGAYGSDWVSVPPGNDSKILENNVGGTVVKLYLESGTGRLYCDVTAFDRRVQVKFSMWLGPRRDTPTHTAGG